MTVTLTWKGYSVRQLLRGAEAIHPGFGFLSENSKFAELCDKCNITFIGPSAEVIEKTGNKQEARNTMIKAGVPVIPGTKEPVMDAAREKRLPLQSGILL